MSTDPQEPQPQPAPADHEAEILRLGSEVASLRRDHEQMKT
jgi:hypothetical protein